MYYEPTDRSNEIKYNNIKFIEFEAVVAYTRGYDIKTNLLSGDGAKLYDFCLEFFIKFNQHPTDDYLENLSDFKVPEELNNEEFINEELQKYFLTQQIQRKSAEVANTAVDDPHTALKDWEQFSFTINNTLDREDGEIQKFTDIDQRLNNFFDSDKGVIKKRCEFGLPTFDENTGGLCDGDLSIIIGATNQGKSWLSKYIIMYNVLRGKKVVLLPFEEIAEESIRRFDAIFGQLSSTAYINKTLDAFQVNEVQKKAVTWKYQNNHGTQGELWIPPIKDIKRGSAAEISNLYKKFDADLIVVDQLSNMSKSLDWKDIAEFAKDLKGAAIAAQRPLLALAQAKINMKKGIDEVGLEVVALGEEIARNADSAIYVGNDTDSDEMNTKLFKLLKTRRGKKDIITRNVWNLSYSTIQEAGILEPEALEKKAQEKKTFNTRGDSSNTKQALSKQDFAFAWSTKK